MVDDSGLCSTPMSGPRRGQGATSNYDGWSGFNKYLKNSAPGHVGAWAKTTGRAPMSISLTPHGRCVFTHFEFVLLTWE